MSQSRHPPPVLAIQAVLAAALSHLLVKAFLCFLFLYINAHLNFKKLYVSMCMCVCVYVHVCAHTYPYTYVEAQRSEDGVRSLEAGLMQSVSHPAWVLGTESQFSPRAASTFNQ